VEVLEAMDYNLLGTEDEWKSWRKTLWRFEEAQTIKSEKNEAPGPWEREPYTNYSNSIETFQHIDHSQIPGKDSNKDVASLLDHSTTSSRLAYVTIGSPIIRYINNSDDSPFERCSPRYHLSTSPSYYRSVISPSNPLYYLSPFPISSSSANSTPALTSSIGTRTVLNGQELQKQEKGASSAEAGSTSVSKVLPSIAELHLNPELDWPPLSDSDAIAT
jgi:hypothetical protein